MEDEIVADTPQFNPYAKGFASMSRSAGRHPHASYKGALFVNDLIWSLLAFFGCALLLSDTFDPLSSLNQAATLFIIALAAIVLFQSCQLYNYHVIYDVKKHLTRLAMAWGCAAVTLLSVFAILTLGGSATRVALVAVTIVIAGLLLLLRNYNEEYSTQLMTAIGLGFIIVGWLGFQKEETIPVFHQALPSLVAGFLVTVGIVSLSRYLLVQQLFNKVLRRRFRRQTVIVGPNEQAERIARYIIDNNAPFWVTGVMGKPSKFGKKLPVNKDHLGEVVHLPRVVADNVVTEVIVTDETIDKQTLVALLDYCVSRRINVWFPPSYMPVISVKLVIDHFCDLPMIRLGTQKNIWLFNKLKYSFDALLTLPVFVLQLPLFAAIAAAVKLTSRGPVFYRPTAIGKNGSPFTMYKFRSMCQDADCAVHKDYVTRLIKGEIKSDCSGQVLKITDDCRITAVGRIIRKLSLDELPQLLNVLKGDMSLIGPRPCLPYEYECYEEWHKKRAAIRPGISGLWQVSGRSEVSFEDMILLDLYYLYNRSFALDFSILLETVVVVFSKKGAY